MRAGRATTSLVRAAELYSASAPDLATSTVKRIRYEVNRWNRVVGETPVESIDLSTVTAFRAAAVKQQLSPRSIESNVSTVRLLVANCRDLGLCADVPPPGRRLRQKQPAPQPATQEELRRLWDAADAARWPKPGVWITTGAWWRAWMALGYWTGLRLTDLTWTLKADHCGTDAIRYTANKTGCCHVFPLTDRLRRIVRQATETGEALLACPRSPTRLRHHLESICDAAGIRRLTPKNLRQAAVTEWTKADARAGELIHGCGLPSVLRHYLYPLEILAAAAPRVAWPFPDWESGQRQLLLFR